MKVTAIVSAFLALATLGGCHHWGHGHHSHGYGYYGDGGRDYHDGYRGHRHRDGRWR